MPTRATSRRPTTAARHAAKSTRSRKPPDLPGQVRMTPRQKIRDLIARYRQKLAVGRGCYQQADVLLQEIMAKCQPGKRIDVGDGLYAVVVDLFEQAEGGKVFQPVAVRRYELQIQDADGKTVRLRDRRKKR